MMAGQAALEVHRRRMGELDAQVKAAALAKPKMGLPGLEKSLEKTLLDRTFRPGLGR